MLSLFPWVVIPLLILLDWLVLKALFKYDSLVDKDNDDGDDVNDSAVT